MVRRIRFWFVVDSTLHILEGSGSSYISFVGSLYPSELGRLWLAVPLGLENFWFIAHFKATKLLAYRTLKSWERLWFVVSFGLGRRLFVVLSRSRKALDRCTLQSWGGSDSLYPSVLGRFWFVASFRSGKAVVRFYPPDLERL